MNLPRILVALTVVSSLTYGLHYYLWSRLIRAAAFPAPWHGVLTALLVVLALSIPLGMVLMRTVPRSVAAPFAYVSYGWLGLMFFLLVGTAVSDLVRLFSGFLPAFPADPTRRLAFARFLAGSAAALGAGATGFAVWSASKPVGVKRVRIPLAKLPEGASGYRIAQLTDVHIGPTLGRDFLERVVRTVNAMNPDVIVITGDLVDGSVRELGAFVAPLADLRARDGVFFVTGNHEYYSGADAWIAHLRTLGVRVLRNERAEIGPEGARFDLAGVDDYTAHGFGGGHGMDIPRALAGRDTSRAVVLLAHQPKAIDRAADAGVDLQLSGHTHGGQMAPLNFLVSLQQPYNAGLFTHRGGTKIYVSRGTGYWGPPMRLAAPAEITDIELVRG